MSSPFWSGKVNSGALSLTFMSSTPFREIYGPLRRALSLALIAATLVSQAVTQTTRTPSKGPRAVGILEFDDKNKVHLIPVTIMLNGEFYDASAYKASPVPMAL